MSRPLGCGSWKWNAFPAQITWKEHVLVSTHYIYISIENKLCYKSATLLVHVKLIKRAFFLIPALSSLHQPLSLNTTKTGPHHSSEKGTCSFQLAKYLFSFFSPFFSLLGCNLFEDKIMILIQYKMNTCQSFHITH